MMNAKIVQQYDFVTEVIPPLVVGIMLNLVGRYACDHWLNPALLQFGGASPCDSLTDQIFLDMIGTLYTAIMVGPWWAATVGVASNAINGGFYDAYFPFAAVNILGGLAWGYYANIAGLRARLAERRPTVSELPVIYIALVFIGTLVCGLASSVTHLIIYPPMGHALTCGPTYGVFRQWQVFRGNENAILVSGDLMRDFIDKSISVFIGIICVILSPAVSMQPSRPPLFARLKTDIPSIFWFSIVNGFYLLAARIEKPILTLAKTDRPIRWLSEINVIGLLYVAIAIALLAFLFLTFDVNESVGWQVEARRLKRMRIYSEIAPPNALSTLSSQLDFRIAQSRKIYGLIGAIAFWPVRDSIDVTIHGGVYLSVTALAVLDYYYQNNKFVGRYDNANRNIKALHDWMDITAPNAAASFLALFTELISGGSKTRGSSVCRSARTDYQLVYVPRNTTLSSKGLKNAIAASTGQIVLVAVVTGNKIIDHAVQQDIEGLISDTVPNAVYLVSLTEGDNDENLIRWLRENQRRGIEIGLLNWHDVEDAIGSAEGGGMATEILIKSRVRTLDLIAGSPRISELTAATNQPPDPKALAERALPSLAHIMDHLPHGNHVFDLGAGCGRHTLRALAAGHSVLAVEPRPDTFAQLAKNVAATGKAACRATLIAGSYMDLNPLRQGTADLVILTGVLQHLKSEKEFDQHLRFIATLAIMPAAKIYIEMLFGMLFDGKMPDDGRLSLTIAKFESLLGQALPEQSWAIERVSGPTFRKQDFSGGPRSFMPVSRTVELTSVEYLLTRKA